MFPCVILWVQAEELGPSSAWDLMGKTAFCDLVMESFHHFNQQGLGC